jgi:glycosyltransferase involved in cell wall biosynthesis
MVTRLLRQCGLDLGREADLMPAQKDNPDGFWGNIRFVTLNDEILNQLGGAWDLPPKSGQNFREKRFDALRSKASSLVAKFDPNQTWGWKDPRNSLTWDFRKKVLPSLRTLIVVRNPLEVAYSMRQRNGTSYAFGLRLWEVYNRRLLESTDPATRLSAEERKRQEFEVIDQTDETWVVSDFEREILRKELPQKSVQVVPTIVDVPGSTMPFSLRRDFLFIGGFQHTPNIDAVLYFTREIYPLVHERLPEARFYVIGDKAPPDVIGLANEHIIVAGLQPDVRPYVESVKLSVAPLRYGAGIKGKINLSMGFGVPVVATSLAVEGMELKNREDILIADKPDDFAAALVELYQSEPLWQQISKSGVAKTKASYSIDVAEKQLACLFNNDRFDPLGRSSGKAVQTVLVPQPSESDYDEA